MNIEQQNAEWIQDTIEMYMEIGYTEKEATSLAWSNFLDFS